MGLTRVRSKGRSLAVMSIAVVGLTLLGTPSALAATVYRVDEDHDAGWHRQATTDPACGSGAPTGSQTFEPGPAGVPSGTPPTPGPPGGAGSLEFRTGTNGNTIQRFRNERYEGKKISDLTGLSYWTYVDPESAPINLDPNNPGLNDFQVAVSIVLRISETGDGQNTNTLTYEPAYQGDVERGEWQFWDASSPNAKWYLGQSSDQAIADLRALSGWTFSGKATIDNETPTLGGVMLSAGCGHPSPWTNFVGNTDEFTIRFAGDPDVTVYDMEPMVPGGAEHLDCSPETDINPAGSLHTINCTATNAAGTPANGTRIVAEITGANDPDGDTPESPDLRCTTDAEGECPLRHGPGGSYTTSRAGETTYRAWIDEGSTSSDATVEADLDEEQDETSDPGTTPEGDDGDNTDVVQKTWAASRLDCIEETVTLPVGSSNTITCTATDATNAGVANTFIDMEATGVNDPDGFSSNSLFSPDFSCETGTDGKCSMIHGTASGGKGTTTTAGRTTYRAWIDADNRNASHEADTSEGKDPTSPGARSEPDQTDVMEANWTSTTSSPTPGPTCFTPSPTPSGSPSPTPTPSGTPCPVRSSTPTPTPSNTSTPRPTPTPTPTGRPDDRLQSGPCEGYLPDSRQARPGGGVVIVGTTGPDELTGSSGDDLICGLGGNDELRGKRGSDSIFGGRGFDSLYGDNGADSLKGGAGRDDLHGGKGRDRLNGGDGRDRCVGGNGRNRLRSCEVRVRT